MTSRAVGYTTRAVRQATDELGRARIDIPDSDRYPGEAHVGAFERTAHELEAWLVEHV